MPYDANLVSAAAAAFMQRSGIPMSPAIPFFRLGEPFVIPVSPASADNEFAIQPPEGATVFQYTNNNPFSVRLRGTGQGKAFVQVSATTGWLWLPGTSRIYTSVMPRAVSVMSVDGPNASVQTAQRAGSGVIELQYGIGS